MKNILIKLIVFACIIPFVSCKKVSPLSVCPERITVSSIDSLVHFWCSNPIRKIRVCKNETDLIGNGKEVWFKCIYGSNPPSGQHIWYALKPNKGENRKFTLEITCRHGTKAKVILIQRGEKNTISND